MIKDVFDLYEFSMVGANKPSEDCCVFLLRKVTIGKRLDMGLFLGSWGFLPRPGISCQIICLV